MLTDGFSTCCGSPEYNAAYIDDPDSTNGATLPVYHTYLLTADLETGEIVLDKEFDLGEGVFLCTHFFDPVNKLYLLQRDDNKLLLVNPVTGTITDVQVKTRRTTNS